MVLGSVEDIPNPVVGSVDEFSALRGRSGDQASIEKC